jgi:hypothetical protein
MVMTDPEGRKLILPRISDSLRHKAVWAVYKFRKDLHCAEARSSEFVDLTAAKATADALNSSRDPAKDYYFKVCRVAPLHAPEAEPGTLSADE